MLPRPFALLTAVLLASSVARAQSLCAEDPVARDPWDRARAPALVRFCDLLAQAEACLREDPKRAAETAQLAAREMPDRWEPLSLRGRAMEATGSFAAAIEAFDQARSLDEGALADASALLSLARARVALGDDPGAREAYRALLPRLPSLADASQRSMATIDAALALLREGPENVDTAASILRAAVSSSAPPHRSLAAAALALALDRQGSRAEALAMADEARRGGAGAWFRRGGTSERLPGSPADQRAIVAEITGDARKEDALAAWDAVSRAGGPWAAHARARAADLRRSPRTPARGKDRP